MGKRILNEEQIIDVLWGSTLMGGGGGGPMQVSLNLLSKFKADHPEIPIEIELFDWREMSPSAYAAMTCGVGAPSVIKETFNSKHAANAFASLKEIISKVNPDKSIEYSHAAELGGFNSFVPMLISLIYKIPLIDGDCNGRAVPNIDTSLPYLNNCDLGSMSAMADDNNNSVIINLANPKDGAMSENLGRYICVAFGMASGFSGGLMRSDDFKERIADGSITLTEKIGHVMRNSAKKKEDVFARLRSESIVDCKLLGKGKIKEIEIKTDMGFDVGKVIVANDKELTICYQNENMLVLHDGKPVMTVPDIITTYDLNTGIPVTNADIKEGMDVAVGLIKVDDKWWKNPKMFDVWRPILKRFGYTGDAIPYVK